MLIAAPAATGLTVGLGGAEEADWLVELRRTGTDPTVRRDRRSRWLRPYVIAAASVLPVAGAVATAVVVV